MYIAEPSWLGVWKHELSTKPYRGDARLGRPGYIERMHSFRQRPLTWLFLIATVCLDLLLLAAEADNTLGAMMFGQSFMVGGWLVLGTAHRLLRAAVFLAAVLGMSTLTAYHFHEPYFSYDRAWGISIVMVSVLAGSAAVMTLLWNALLNRMSGALNYDAPNARWQFPVIELFGWTIVVAIASATMRFATFEAAGDNIGGFVATMIFAGVAALLMALFAPLRARRGVGSMVLAALAVAAMFAMLPVFVPRFSGKDVAIVAGSYVYVVLWIAVQRLDDRDTAVRKGVASGRVSRS